MVKLPQLTGMRFIAALTVFCSHLRWDPDATLLARLFHQGYVGVSFFFVLSGFVMSYAYKEKLKDGSISVKTYSLLRIARLAPLHIATALPFFLLLYDGGWPQILTGTFNIFLLQSWFPHSDIYYSLNVPSWSLSNEIFFYMVFCWLVLLGFSHLRALFLVLTALVVIAAVLASQFLPSFVLMGSKNFSHWLFYIFPVFRLLEFVSGMIIYDLWRRGHEPKRGFFLLSICALTTAMSLAPKAPEEFRYSLFYLPFVSFLLFASLRADAFGLHWLTKSWAVFLGGASFAFYLIHKPMLSFLKKIPSFACLSDIEFMFASLALVVVVSSVVYHFFEKPIETFLRRKILSND